MRIALALLTLAVPVGVASAHMIGHDDATGVSVGRSHDHDSPHAASNPVPLVLAVVGLGVLAAAGHSLRRRSALLPALVLASLVATVLVTAADNKKATPPSLKHFEPFKDKVKYHADDDYFYIESDGMPAHPMMVGITA